MKCPTCNVNLQMSERQGVEIDYCPQCRGVWLDRGELDKIIEKAAPGEQKGNSAQETTANTRGYHDNDSDYGAGKTYPGKRDERRKREGFLGDLFDF